jgi:hypothetical protein
LVHLASPCDLDVDWHRINQFFIFSLNDRHKSSLVDEATV